MNPRKLKLKGFRGIKDGLGLDAYELDLEGLGDARLVAIAGPNGKGKSTVLDNLHPFPILPSRATSYSVSAFSMYDHIVPPEASKTLEWDHAGRIFRSDFIWRVSGKRKSSEAYLFEHQDGMGWVPARCEDGTVSDGKVDTYMRTLIPVLGTPEMFFSSVFSAQGRRKLFEYKQAELKELLAELLNESEIAKFGADAALVLRSLNSSAEALRVAAMPPANAPDLEVLGARISDSETSIAGLTTAKAAHEVALRVAQEAVAKAKAEVAGDTSKEVRERLERELSTLAAGEARESDQRSGRRAQLSADAAALKAAIARSSTELAAQRKSRAEGISFRQKLLAQREAVSAAPATSARLAGEVLVLEDAVRVANERLKAQITAQGELAVLDGELKAKRESYTQAKVALGQIEVRAQLTGEVPCNGSDLQPKCKLLKEAMEAVARIPEARKALEDLAAAGAKLNERRIGVEAKTKEGGEPAKEIAQAETTLAALRKAKQDADQLAALAPAVERAQAEVDQLQQELANLEAEHAKASQERSERQEAIATQLAAIEVEGQTSTAFYAAERAKITEELAKVKAPDATVLTTAQAAYEAQASKLRQVDHDLNRAQSQEVALKAQLAAAREGARHREQLQARYQRIRGEMAYWQLLAKALGKDGIVAMLIDEAGPTLASIANDILLACYGRRFTVSIVTQKPLANGELAETFDIVVHDAESDEAKSLSVMSGGQKVWINEALTRAIALYRQGTQHYATLFGDEADGPLDPEKKRMFVAMQRKVLELGGYKRAFYISQTPELIGMADKQVQL